MSPDPSCVVKAGCRASRGGSADAVRQGSTRAVRQGGIGATIVLFTIALIMLVGAALAYASRGNPSAITAQGAKVRASVMLKQTADYRNAFNRYVLDSGDPALMTFHTGAANAATELFNTITQYGTYQAPPPQSVVQGSPTPNWRYKDQARVPGVGTGGIGSLIYVPAMTRDACIEVNHQLYGTRTVPDNATAGAALTAAGTVLFDASLNGQATGCYHSTADDNYVFYATLNEA